MHDAVEALHPDPNTNASRAARGRPVMRVSLPADVVNWLRANAPPSRARAGGGVSALVEQIVRDRMAVLEAGR